MSIQSEGKDTKAGNDDRGKGDGARSGTDGTGDIGATGESAAGQGNRQSGQQSSQQRAMPPSETDDDQYDQGTAQRAP